MWTTDNTITPQPIYSWTPAGWLPTSDVAMPRDGVASGDIEHPPSIFRSRAAIEPTTFTSLPVPGFTVGPSVIDAIIASLVRVTPLAPSSLADTSSSPAIPASADPAAMPVGSVETAAAAVSALTTPERRSGIVPDRSANRIVAAQPSVRRAVLGYSSSRVRSVAHGARRKVSEIWAGRRDPRTVHVSQVPSRFNPQPTQGNRDCGPASVVMALRMVGVSVPGVAVSSAPQRLINRVRKLAGNTDSGAATTNFELERALARAGVTTREINDADSIKDAIISGRPVILNGNPRHPGAYGWKFSATQMLPYNGGHWIVVSGWDEKAHKFIINDPLSTIGAVKVTPSQLEAYRGGSLGIEVAR